MKGRRCLGLLQQTLQEGTGLHGLVPKEQDTVAERHIVDVE
jgi:hypothetical protein